MDLMNTTDPTGGGFNGMIASEEIYLKGNSNPSLAPPTLKYTFILPLEPQKIKQLWFRWSIPKVSTVAEPLPVDLMFDNSAVTNPYLFDPQPFDKASLNSPYVFSSINTSYIVDSPYAKLKNRISLITDKDVNETIYDVDITEITPKDVKLEITPRTYGQYKYAIKFRLVTFY